MLYGTIPHVDRPVSRIVFGTAMPTMFNAFRSVYENAPDFPQRLQAAFDLLDAVCQGRGWLLKGNRFDYERCYSVVLDEFRSGKLGRISLERPEDIPIFRKEVNS